MWRSHLRSKKALKQKECARRGWRASARHAEMERAFEHDPLYISRFKLERSRRRRRLYAFCNLKCARRFGLSRSTPNRHSHTLNQPSIHPPSRIKLQDIACLRTAISLFCAMNKNVMISGTGCDNNCMPFPKRTWHHLEQPLWGLFGNSLWSCAHDNARQNNVRLEYFWP